MGGGGLLAGGGTGEETEKGQKGSPPCRREGEAGDSMTACGRDPTGEASRLGGTARICPEALSEAVGEGCSSHE